MVCDGITAVIGIGVTSLGHCHPTVVKAIQQQAGEFIHAQLNCYYHKPALELIERLSKVVPEGLDNFHFANSGAESIENAVKLARHATGRTNVIVFQGGRLLAGRISYVALMLVD